MRLFWKIVLLAALPIGGYWLCKKWDRPTKMEEQPKPTEEDITASQFLPGSGAEAKQRRVGSTEQLIEELSNIDGVTSRVAEELIQRGIYTKDELIKLSHDELMEVKGIGPKRSDKILHGGRSESENN